MATTHRHHPRGYRRGPGSKLDPNVWEWQKLIDEHKGPKDIGFEGPKTDEKEKGYGES